MRRAVNLDWLEIYCLEPLEEPRTIEYYKEQGYDVVKREYGTPVYSEMFTIRRNKKPYIEIRRAPHSIIGQGGFMLPNACHIKLCNEFLYGESPVDEIRAFMVANGLEYKSISRIDICMDFNDFEGDLSVTDFISSYMEGKMSKINQNKLCAHSVDTWTSRVFNSLKWGAPSSAFSTKLYNKTQELLECEDKPWIKQAWIDAGLDVTKDVWRIEFSTSSEAQSRKSKKEAEVFRLHLCHFEDRSKILMRFWELYEKYFDFREVEWIVGKDGEKKLQRKDRCRRVTLLKVNLNDIAYKPSRNITIKKRPDRVYKIMINKLEKLFDTPNTESTYLEAFRALILFLTIRMNLEIKQVKIKGYEEMFKLEAYRYRMSELEREAKLTEVERKERAQFWKLAHKYGYSVLPSDLELPF